MSSFMPMLTSRPLSLIVSLATNSAELATAAIAGGADALKVHANVLHRATGTSFGTVAEERGNFEAIIKAANGSPVGIVPGGSMSVPASEIEQAVELGLNSISVFAHHLPSSWLKVKGASFQVGPDYYYSHEEIIALAQMPEVDVYEAALIPSAEYGQPLTFQDIVRYKMVASSTTKPVVVPSQRFLMPDDVQFLAATGIRAIMIGAVVTGRDAEGVYKTTKAFRAAMDAL